MNSVSLADTFTLGIVPQQSAKKLAKLWTPITNYLSEKTGHTIIFSTAKDIPTFEKRVLAGDYDIAYMNPYHFTVFNQKPGYSAIAKQKGKRIKGIIVVAKDSPLQDLTELAEQTLAFPAPAAFAATVLPSAKLRQENIRFTPKYVSSHDSVYLGVSRGFFPAGGGIQRTFNNTSTQVREKLRVLWTTPGFTPHAIAVKPAMDKQIAQGIKAAFLSMNDNERGKALLNSINFKGIESATDADWDDVRGLDIKLLEKFLN